MPNILSPIMKIALSGLLLVATLCEDHVGHIFRAKSVLFAIAREIVTSLPKSPNRYRQFFTQDRHDRYTISDGCFVVKGTNTCSIF